MIDSSQCYGYVHEPFSDLSARLLGHLYDDEQCDISVTIDPLPLTDPWRKGFYLCDLCRAIIRSNAECLMIKRL